jgi:hypothetical protein
VDFIEKLFGIAPDGGDGSLEALWIGAIVVAGLVFAFRRRIIAALAKDDSLLSGAKIGHQMQKLSGAESARSVLADDLVGGEDCRALPACRRRWEKKGTDVAS